MFCSNCGKQQPDGAKFCASCGTKFEGTPGVAPQVAPQVVVTANPVVTPANNPGYAGVGAESPIDSNVAGLLALFLGSLGIHDFYCGKTSRGVIKLILSLTCIFSIVSCIWTIIDLYGIGKGTYVDGNGLPLKPAPWAKWIIIVPLIGMLVLVLGLGGAVVVPKLFASISKSKASEVGPVFGTYIHLQEAYFVDVNRAGTTTEIGFSFPSSDYFYYDETKYPMGIYAIAKEKMGDCPKGGKWSITSYVEGRGRNKTISFRCDIDSECEYLTPSIKYLCNQQ
jgi:TM2 domain-containing membrane protein YozV/type II secretory pathway pseudopilin PulG